MRAGQLVASAAIILEILAGLLGAAAILTPAEAATPERAYTATGAQAVEADRARGYMGDYATPITWVSRGQATDRDKADDGAWAQEDGVYVVTDLPSEYTASVLVHELAHIRQYAAYGGIKAAVTHYGSRIESERQAQCASMLSGFKHYTAYGVGQAADCSAAELTEARKLIDG